MPPKNPRLAVDEKGSSSRSRSRSRSPGRKAKKTTQAATPVTSSTPANTSVPLRKDVAVKKKETVKDNDIMNLPNLDFQLMMCLTVVAIAVRLFRLQQPTSVVFDEVQ